MSFIIISLLCFFIIIEGTITTLPLVLIVLLCVTVYKKSSWVFLYALLSGLLLDIFTLHTVGSSSIYFLSFILLILLYQRKYEINSVPFVLTTSFIGTFFYLLLFGYNNIVLQASVSSAFAVSFFFIANRKYRTKDPQLHFKT